MATPTLEFATTINWGSGFGASITLKNPAGAAPLSAWQLSFDFAPKITDIWDAKILDHIGTTYIIGNSSYNAKVPPGSSVTFGFNAAPGGSVTPPSNITLNGNPLSGGGGPGQVSLSVGNVSVVAPASGSSSSVSFPITLTPPAKAPFSVSYSTGDLTAHSPAEYMGRSGVIKFAAGDSAVVVSVSVNPASDSSSKTFSLTLSKPSDPTVSLTKASAIATISPRPTNSGAVSFQVVQDWGSGYTGNVTIKNNDAAHTITDWSLTFDYAGTISDIWSAIKGPQTGTRYIIRAESWTNVIAPNSEVSFGFNASPGKVSASTSPTNFVLTDSNSGSVTLPPNAGNTNITAVQGIPKASIALLPLTSSPSGYTLTVSSVSAGQHGTVQLASGSTATYTSAPDYLGSDSFTYTVSDGHGGSATGTVFVTVKAISPPTASDFSVSTPKGAPITIDALSHASDDAGFTLTLASVSSPSNGTATLRPDSTVLYTPTADFVGAAKFTYTVSDGHGRSASGTVTVNVVTSDSPVWPSRVFAPFSDQADWPTYDFVRACRLAGTSHFNLAFIVAGPRNEPSWGGYAEYDVVGTDFSSNIKANIDSLRALGGDVCISFGGAINKELANVHNNASDLQAAYQLVIDTYNLTRIDLDIEGADVGNHTTVDMRSIALAGLQAAAGAKGRKLDISLTLPVIPEGLTADGVNVVRSALSRGVKIACVNIMAMYYGPDGGTNPDMVALAIKAAQNTVTQLRGVFPSGTSDATLWSLIGITPLIGINEDMRQEVFVQEDAKELVSWAASTGIGMLAYWSANRDRPGSVAYNYSGVNQAEFDFAKIMNAFK